MSHWGFASAESEPEILLYIILKKRKSTAATVFSATLYIAPYLRSEFIHINVKEPIAQTLLFITK